MATWQDDIVLCTANDVLKRVFSVSGIVNIELNDNASNGEDSSAEDDIINKRIADVKEYIRKVLLRDAQPILEKGMPYGVSCLSYFDWYDSIFTSDTLPDKLHNPSILKEYAVALTIAELYNFGDSVLSAGIDPEQRQKLYDRWKDKAKEEYDLAFPLLRFDLDADGIIACTEKIGNTKPYSFFRV